MLCSGDRWIFFFFVTTFALSFSKSCMFSLRNAAACLVGGKGKNGRNVLAWSMGNSSFVCNYCHIPKQYSLIIPGEEQATVSSLSYRRLSTD